MTLKDLTRQELLQIYYNEALELLFNQEKITKEWLTKIKEKFKLESFRLGVCFDKDNPSIIEEISVIEKIIELSKANKIYTMNCYDEDYLLNSETYKKLSSHFFKNLDYRLWQHNRNNYKL